MSKAIKSICGACGATFMSVAAFDIHRVGHYLPGGRRCLTIREMQTEGLIQDEKGWWGFNPDQHRPGQADLAARYSQSVQGQEAANSGQHQHRRGENYHG